MRAAWLVVVAGCYSRLTYDPDGAVDAPGGGSACTPKPFTAPPVDVPSVGALQLSVPVPDAFAIAIAPGNEVVSVSPLGSAAKALEVTVSGGVSALTYPGVVRNDADDLTMFATSAGTLAMFTSADNGSSFAMVSTSANLRGDAGTPSLDAGGTVHVMVSAGFASLQEYVLQGTGLEPVGCAYTPTPEQMAITAGSLLQGATLLVYRVELTSSSYQVRSARRTTAADAFVVDATNPVLLQSSTELDTPVLSTDCSTLYFANLTDATFSFVTN